MKKARTISELLRDAGYSHSRVDGHGLYRHRVWNTETGEVVGYMTAAEACLFLHLDKTTANTLTPFLINYGGDK